MDPCRFAELNETIWDKLYDFKHKPFQKGGDSRATVFEERFSILVDAEWSSRKSNRLAKLVEKAEYSAPGASIEDISFLPERKLDKAQILRLASCSYIHQAQNVIILGATGTGKTYLACALGLSANRKIRLPDLLVEIAVA